MSIVTVDLVQLITWGTSITIDFCSGLGHVSIVTVVVVQLVTMGG
jgi:hypothetical protein